MLWEHPRLAESLVQSFRSTNEIPERSLTDGLLQQINRTAYERDFSKTVTENILSGLKQLSITLLLNTEV